MSVNYTTAHGNARSLTHWVRLGNKPATSWIPVRFISAGPWWEPRCWQLCCASLVHSHSYFPRYLFPTFSPLLNFNIPIFSRWPSYLPESKRIKKVYFLLLLATSLTLLYLLSWFLFLFLFTSSWVSCAQTLISSLSTPTAMLSFQSEIAPACVKQLPQRTSRRTLSQTPDSPSLLEMFNRHLVLNPSSMEPWDHLPFCSCHRLFHLSWQQLQSSSCLHQNTEVILGFFFSYIEHPLHQKVAYSDYDHFSSLI